MLWLIYNDYLKENVRFTSYIRFFNWYVWVISSFMMLLTIGLFISYIYVDKTLIFILTVISGGLGGFYFGFELKRVVVKNVGTSKDIHDHDIITLRKVLKDNNINNVAQIDLLLSQIDEELPNLKVSESIVKPLYTFFTLILLPIVSLFVKWLLDKGQEGIIIFLQVFSLIVMIFGLMYMLKPLITQILDLTFRRMKQLKGMLEDLKLLDFLK